MDQPERHEPSTVSDADKLPWEPPILRAYSLEEVERNRPGLVEELRRKARK